MKRLLLFVLPLLLFACKDLPTEPEKASNKDKSELSTEWPTNATRVTFVSSFEWEGNTLVALSAQELSPGYQKYKDSQIWVDVRRAEDMSVKRFTFWNREDGKFPIPYSEIASAFSLKPGDKFEVDFIMTYTFE